MRRSLGRLLQMPVVGPAWSAEPTRGMSQGVLQSLRHAAATFVAASLLHGCFAALRLSRHVDGHVLRAARARQPAAAQRLRWRPTPLRGAGAPERGPPSWCVAPRSGCGVLCSQASLVVAPQRSASTSAAASSCRAPSSSCGCDGGRRLLAPSAAATTATACAASAGAAMAAAAAEQTRGGDWLRRRLRRVLKNHLEARGDAALCLLLAHGAAHRRAPTAPADTS